MNKAKDIWTREEFLHFQKTGKKPKQKKKAKKKNATSITKKPGLQTVPDSVRLDQIDLAGIILAKPVETVRLIYQGEILSMNELRSYKWKDCWKKQNRIKEVLSDLIDQHVFPVMDHIKLEAYYNSRHDTDNPIATSKLLCDTFVEKGFLSDDKKKYYRKTSMEWAEKLPHNTIVFLVHIFQ